MTAITIASIETTVGNLFHAVAAKFSAIEAAVQTGVKDIDQAAPVVESIATAINPAYGAAATVIVDVINAVDAALVAAEGSVAGGVTVSLPADLVADFKAAKAAILAAKAKL